MFSDPVLFKPLPMVQSVTVPSEIEMPEGTFGGLSIPAAELSSLPAMFTDPPLTIKAPLFWVCTEFPELVPKFAVPEKIRINPSLVIVKWPVFNVPPVTSMPASAGIVMPLLGLIEKLPAVGIMILPLLNVRLPPLVIVLVPFMVMVLSKLPLLIINSSKFVLPLIEMFEVPANSIIPFVPGIKAPLFSQLPFTCKRLLPVMLNVPLIIILLQKEGVLTVTVTPAGMVISSFAVGITPPQVEGAFQSPLVIAV